MAKIKTIKVRGAFPNPPITRQPVDLFAQPGPSFKPPARNIGDPTEQDRIDAAWYAQVRAMQAATRGGR